MKKEKVYRVEFMEYGNYSKDSVWDAERKNFIELKEGPFLIRESDLDMYKEYGNGFKELVFVGYIRA